MYLDPKNDIAFRKIFGNENKKEILISFLNSILRLKDKKRIVDIDYSDGRQLPKIRELKETILDVRCTDERGINYIVEMQIARPSKFEKRALYYTSKAYINQIEVGELYPSLNPVIFIGILDFEMFENPDYLTYHSIKDEMTGENKLSDFRFCFIELPKFNKTENEIISVEDKWIYFIKNAKNIAHIPLQVKEHEIKEAYNILEKFNWDKHELEVYDKIGIYRQDERGRVEQGYMEGLEKGEKRGIEQGKQIGIEQGKQIGLKEGERTAKLEIARNMLKGGIQYDSIIILTGLTQKELDELK
ncbi:MAG: hypothetical protein QG635_936 [Bacteroidota bacterium]|nr:hypothetical protein [Bacteroidota bacterium]